MSDVEQAAEQSVARGVGFGALAIALVVAGLAGYPLLALQDRRGADAADVGDPAAQGAARAPAPLQAHRGLADAGPAPGLAGRDGAAR